MITILIIIALAGFVGYGAGYFMGYTDGVAETETRWSDTAAKADWITRYGDPSTLDGRRYSDKRS